MVRGEQRGGLPKFFKGYGDLDAIGRLGGVEVDIGGSARGGHGDDLVGQLVDSTEHESAIPNCTGANEK